MDEIWDIHPQMTQTQVRSALAVFLFKGEDVFKLVGTLSGGERARVLLLKLMLSKANFLLLDEPTNHLDIGSCEALENALSGYDGTLFVVSHDRYLINKLADKVYVLGKEGAKLYLGNYDSYLEQREKEQAAAQEQNPQPVKRTCGNAALPFHGWKRPLKKTKGASRPWRKSCRTRRLPRITRRLSPPPKRLPAFTRRASPCCWSGPSFQKSWRNWNRPPARNAERRTSHMKAKIITLGCKVNQYESEAMLEALLAGGFQEAASGEEAP